MFSSAWQNLHLPVKPKFNPAGWHSVCDEQVEQESSSEVLLKSSATIDVELEMESVGEGHVTGVVVATLVLISLIESLSFMQGLPGATSLSGTEINEVDITVAWTWHPSGMESVIRVPLSIPLPLQAPMMYEAKTMRVL